MVKKLTPFILSHEKQHVFFQDIHRGGDNDACNPQEVRANKKSNRIPMGHFLRKWRWLRLL